MDIQNKAIELLWKVSGTDGDCSNSLMNDVNRFLSKHGGKSTACACSTGDVGYGQGGLKNGG